MFVSACTTKYILEIILATWVGCVVVSLYF